MRHSILWLAVMLIPALTLSAQSAENLALRPDAVPIARVTAPTGGGDINIINDQTVADQSYNSYDGANAAGEDWYGYTWSEPLYFDSLVFYEGEPSAAGGYWKSLTVQYTADGTTWTQAGDVTIAPAYDYSDDPDRPPYSRYDLTFTGCLGNGVRIYGQPGGPSFFTSIAELEVYGTKPQVVCTRQLPTSYQPDQNLDVSLTLDIDAESPPTSLTLVETVPSGLTVAVPGTGDTSQPGSISWSFGEGEVENLTLDYSLAVPGGQSGIINFTGTLAYPGTSSQDITGSQFVAPAPLPPSDLRAAFDVDAHLSWSPAAQEGIAGYTVYRSEDGGDFTDISGLILDNNYVDFSVEQGKTYRYKVISQNTTGARSDLADSTPTAPAEPSMLRRQFEDYNFEGGNFPGGASTSGYAAGSRSDLSGTDFFYQSPDQTNDYRPDDAIAIPAFNDEEQYLGSTTPQDWWRYTFDVPEDAYVKIGAIRAASDGDAIIEFLWDEKHQGWFSFNTGGFSNWEIIPVDTPAFNSSHGTHTLRIILSTGTADLDYFGIGFQQPEPSRVTVFSDNFDSYDSDDDLTAIDPDTGVAKWTIERSPISQEGGAWQLHCVTCGSIGYFSEDLPGMTDRYVVSVSTFSDPGYNDEKLITSEIDCTDYVGVMVEFDSNIQVNEDDVGYDPQVFDLDIRTYDDDTQSWSDWETVFRHEGSDGDDPSPQFVDISGHADGKRIKLRWHFHDADYDYFWAIDNVRVTGESPTGRILSLGVAGDAISLTWTPFGARSYRVQYTDDLTSGTWSDVPGAAWPITEEQWTGDQLSGTKSRFYRVVSAEELPPGRILSAEIAADTISLTWEAFGTGSYRVQYTDDLTSGSWLEVPGTAWPITEEQWTGDDISGIEWRFYRVISQ